MAATLASNERSWTEQKAMLTKQLEDVTASAKNLEALNALLHTQVENTVL